MKLLSIALFVTSIPLAHADCLVLRPGETLAVSPARLPCINANVGLGEAAQLIIESPLDTAIYVQAGPKERIVDAFDFGRETATLTTPGKYVVSIRVLSPPLVNSQLVMSLRALPLQLAEEWMFAEDLATRFKTAPSAQNGANALHAWEALTESDSMGRTYLAMGELAFGGSNYRESRSDFERSRALCVEVGDKACVAEADADAGISASRVSDYNAALELSQRADAELRDLGDILKRAKVLSNLGLIYWRIGDLQSGISASDQAASMLRGRDEIAYAIALNNLGLCHQVAGEYSRSASYFRKAIEIFERHKNARAVRGRLNLGRTLFLSGDLTNARALLEEALARAQKDRLAQGEALNNLGQLFIKLHLFETARQRLELALSIFRSLDDQRNEAAAEHYLGLLARDRRDDADAVRYLEEALAIRVKRGLREDAAESLAALAGIQRDGGNLENARDNGERALKLLESVRLDVPGPLRASFYARKRSLFDLLVDLDASPTEPGRGLLTSERVRSRALLDQLAAGHLLQQIPPELQQRRKQIQHQIDVRTAELAGADREREDALRDGLELLIAGDEAVEAEIRQGLKEHRLAEPLQSVETLQHEALPENCALLEYYLGEKHSYLWLVQRTKLRMFQLPPRAVVERQVLAATILFGQLGKRLTQPAKQAAFMQAMRRLSATLLGPLAGLELPARLIIAPDGAMLYAPLAALQRVGDSRPLGLDHELIQVPAAGYLIAGNPVRPLSAFPKTIAAFVDPVFSAEDPRVHNPATRKTSGSSLSRLPFTEELDVTNALVPPANRLVLRGFEATRGALEKLPAGQYALLHLSTHAWIDNRTPELSWVALSLVNVSGRRLDGYLRPFQLANLKLPGTIVVLSACDTALGKQVLGEGLAGLANSLFYAGAAQLVVTLTQVDAEGSSQLLAETYRELFSSARPGMERALTIARRRLAASVRWRDPYYWASFVVLGRPSPDK